MFDKSAQIYPIKNEAIFLNSCGVSPLYGACQEKEAEFSRAHSRMGNLVFSQYPYQQVMDALHDSVAQLLRVNKEDISYTKSTAEGLCMIANGYPLDKGDQIISYIHEYPANHYPWKLQERRGAELVLLPDAHIQPELCNGKPSGWSMEDLERLVTSRTKMIAVSHVQFTSGFAADLKQLGQFCKMRGIDLIVDAAQSLGCRRSILQSGISPQLPRRVGSG